MDRRVLLVDDNETILRVLVDGVALYCEDCHILVASDAESALEHVRREPVDLILTDYWMPGMNGLELARTVRQISPETRIVVMTGLPSRELLDGPETASLEGFMLKPLRLTELWKVLQDLVEQENEPISAGDPSGIARDCFPAVVMTEGAPAHTENWDGYLCIRQN